MISALKDLKTVCELTQSMYQEDTPVFYYYAIDDHVAIYTAGSLYGYDKIVNNSDIKYIIQDIIEYEREFVHYHREILPLFTYAASVLAYKIYREKYLKQGKLYIGDDDVASLSKMLDELLEQHIIITDGIEHYLEHICQWLGCDNELLDIAKRLLENIGSDGFYALEYSLIDNDRDIIHPIRGYSFYTASANIDFIQDAVIMENVIENPILYLFNGTFSDLDVLRAIVEFIMRSGRRCVIIASGYSDKFIQSCKRLHSLSYCEIYPIVLPMTDDRRYDVLSDISYMSGAMILGPEYSIIEPSKSFGTCDAVIISERVCSIVPSQTAHEKIKQRVAAIKEIMSDIKSIEERIFLNERAAKLEGKVAILSIGGKNRLNREFRRDKFIRAISFAQNSMKNGIIQISSIEKIIDKIYKQKEERFYIYAEVIKEVLNTSKVDKITYYPFTSLRVALLRLLELYQRWYMVDKIVRA